MGGIVLALAMLLGEPSADLPTQVTQEVEKLNANALADRTAAEQALVKLGPAALEFLPDTDDRTPPEVAQRLKRIRQALEQAQSEATAQPSLVTLIGQDLPLVDVIARISQETGNQIVDHREAFGQTVTEPRLKCEFEKKPFWPVIDAVMDDSDLMLYEFSGEPGLHLVNRPPNRLPRTEGVSYAGPFRIEAKAFEAMRELRQPENGSLRLTLGIAWEPRLKPIAVRLPMTAIEATGSDGQPIEVITASAEPEAQTNDSASAIEVQIPFVLPNRKVAKVASLKGRLKVLVPSPAQTFTFDTLPIVSGGKPPKKVEQRKAGVTVAVDEVRKNNDVWEVRTRVKFDRPGDALDSFRTWILQNQAHLVGKDKQPITPGAYEQTRQSDSEVGIAYLFDLPDGPKDLSLVYQTPTAIFELPIDFELHDLPLP